MRQVAKKLTVLTVLVAVLAALFLPVSKVSAAQQFAELSSKSVEIAVGGKFDLRDLLTNKKGTIKFVNSDKSVVNATKKGVATGVKEGTAKVTIKQTIKKQTKTLGKVTVKVISAKEVDSAVIDGNLLLSDVRLAYHESGIPFGDNRDLPWYEEWYEIDGPSDLWYIFPVNYARGDDPQECIERWKQAVTYLGESVWWRRILPHIEYTYGKAQAYVSPGEYTEVKPGETFYQMAVGLDKDREPLGYAILKLTMPEATEYIPQSK